MSLDLPPRLGPVLATWSALMGALVGSFLNVVVARVPAGESIVTPRSRCPRCKTPIRWYDNVPVLSWLLLRGRCRACGGRISARYPVVELLAAAGALVVYSRHGLTVEAAAEFVLFAALLALALIDLDTWLLPHAITWPLLAAGLLLSAAGVTPAATFRNSAYGAGVGFATFALFAWLGEKALKREALGFGDVWLLSALGAWMGVGSLLPITLFGSVQGALVGVLLIVLGRGEPGPGTPAPGVAPADEEAWVPPRNAVPFGPFLVLAALEWLWAGAWVASLLPSLALFR